MSDRVDALAAKLRDDPPELDELGKARMERAFLERRGVPEAIERSRMPVFVAGLAIGAAAAVVLTIAFVGGEEPAPTAERPDLAKVAPATGAPVVPVEEGVAFEALRDGVPVRRGHFSEGETVQTADGQLMRVRFGGERAAPTSLVEVSPDSRVRFGRAWGDDLEVRLERGNVRVEFHPERRGEEHLAVRTRDGRVEVVGTAFEVRLGPSGTEVIVEEGTVRLVGHTGEPRLVSHGERAWLRRAGGEERATAPDRPSTSAAAVEVEGQPEAEPESESAVERSAATAMVPTLQPELRFELADRYFARGDFEQARHELYAITRSDADRPVRAQAWVRVAEAFARERNWSRSAEAYRRAARAGRGTVHGDGALFALGRLLEEQGDTDGARAAHLRYLQVAPHGALAAEARRALCALGETEHCP